MTIERLIWDDWNREHILKRGCTAEDVDDMCRQRVHHWRDSYKNRKVFLGKDANGKVLALVLGPVPDAPEGTFYPFGARPADRKERDFFEHKKREEDSADR